MSLPNYKPIWSETVILLGSGAMAELGIPTTYQMGETISKLTSTKERKSINERIKNLNRFNEVEEELSHFLTVLGDVFEEPDITNITDIAKKILPDNFSENQVTLRIIQWKDNYDWNALRRLANKIPVENEDYSVYLVDLFNVIDGSLLSNQGVQVYDEAMKKHVFIYPYKLRIARNLLVLLCSLMIACAYHKTVKTNKEKFKSYLDFNEILGKLMQDEAIDLSDIDNSNRIFYLMSYSIISFNFDPVFLWLRFFLHNEVNYYPPIIGKYSKESKIYHDFASLIAIRDNYDRNLFETYYPINETVARHLNKKKYTRDLLRICKYYLVHGFTNIRECENCGKPTIVWGEWEEIPNDLFLPLPFKTDLFKNTPSSKEEEEALKEGIYDAVQCSFCGNMTYSNNNTLIMQTAYKGGHPSFIEEIQRDAKLSLSEAKHVILLGYSLPPDDVVWRSTILAKQKSKDVFCSVVVGYKGKDKWLLGEEIKEYVIHVKNEKDNKEWAAYGIQPIEAAIAIFGENNVRAYAGGIPNVWCTNNVADKYKIIDLLYPENIFPDGVAKLRIQNWEKFNKN